MTQLFADAGLTDIILKLVMQMMCDHMLDQNYAAHFALPLWIYCSSFCTTAAAFLLRLRVILLGHHTDVLWERWGVWYIG